MEESFIIVNESASVKTPTASSERVRVVFESEEKSNLPSCDMSKHIKVIEGEKERPGVTMDGKSSFSAWMQSVDDRFKKQDEKNKKQDENIAVLQLQNQHLLKRLDEGARVYNEHEATILHQRRQLDAAAHEISEFGLDGNDIKRMQEHHHLAVCPICSSAPNSIALRPCMHMFCSECLADAFTWRHGETRFCPICKGHIEERIRLGGN